MDRMTDNASALWETLILIGKIFCYENDYIGAGPMFAEGIGNKEAEKMHVEAKTTTPFKFFAFNLSLNARSTLNALCADIKMNEKVFTAPK